MLNNGKVNVFNTSRDHFYCNQYLNSKSNSGSGSSGGSDQKLKY